MKSNDNISLQQLERLVHIDQQNHEEAIATILKILMNAEARRNINLQDNQATDEALINYTRLASALTTFFANPKVGLTRDGFQILIGLKRHLLGIFELSGFRGTDHVLALVLTQVDQKQDGYSTFSIKTDIQLMKFLLLYSLSSEVDVDFSGLLKKSPELVLPAYVSLLAEECILSLSAVKKRDKLFQLGTALETIPLNEDILARMSNLWMYCSYAEHKNKHDIKLHLNIAMQKFMHKHRISAPPLPLHRKIKQRPVLVIPLERFTSGHAMYRCYAASIQQLREKFELVGISEERYIDDNSKKLFDKVVNFKVDELGIMNALGLKKLVGKIVKLKPDIIFFPSLGMSTWALFIANLRLAPIQLMTLGHPATSKSPFIDYVLLEEILFSKEQDCFSEKVVLQATDSIAYMQSPDSIQIQPSIKKNPELIKIAIPSNSLKLNLSFMDVCKEILENSHKTVEFHFFPAEKGITHHKIKQRIHDWIPSAVVYPRTDYNTYKVNLNECDIHLSPFPFGGANSNIDSMQQGIPIVALQGHEPHSRADSLFITLSNLPDWLLTHSKEEYVAATLRLINNDDERVAISENLLTQNFDNIFRDYEFNDHKPNFGKTLDWIYQNHEAIQKDARKVWTIEAQSESMV